MVTCPTCGHKSRPASQPGQEARCPACLNSLPGTGPTVPSMLSRPKPADPSPAAPPNRTLLAQPEVMVRYTCPRCKKSLESPASFAGQKLNCPECDQRLQIPQPSAPPAPPPVNKTILATEESAAPAPAPRAAPSPPLAPPLEPWRPSGRERVEQEEHPEPVRREACLECGIDVTNRARVQTCPDCGTVLCSAMCYREHRYHAHRPRRRERRPDPVECDCCGSTRRPYSNTVISEGGWVTFAVLLILFFPLCWIGLLITEQRWHCVDCGARL